MYNIGQLRKSQITSYTVDNSYRKDLISNKISVITFKDPCLYLTGSDVVSPLSTYYLSFKIKQLPNAPQDFTIILKNDNALASSSAQNIKVYNIKQGPSTDYVSFELIFTPNAIYNQIVFELERLDIDYSGSSRVMDLEVIEFKKINNVIADYLSSRYQGLTELKKIGLQGRPGMLFTIDGEEMRIGRSGIYELYHKDISVTYMGFVVNNAANEDYFILDFKY